MTMQSLDVAVCGAGIGGLAAAAALANDGHRVVVFERFATPQPVGAGLMLQPTGLAALNKLGIRQQLDSLGRPLEGIKGSTANGRTIFNIVYKDLDASMYSLGIHRGALFQCLYDNAKSAGASITTDAEVHSSTLSSSKRRLTSRKGFLLGEFDLIVDACGLSSPLRRAHAIAKLDRPYPYGAVWGIADEPSSLAQPNCLSQVYDGASVMAGILPIGSLEIDGPAKVAFFWSLRADQIQAWQTADFFKWQQHVRVLWPTSEHIVSQFKSSADLTPARYADLQIVQPIAERLVFIGDAARAASPQLGQGANLALIDAVCLAGTLRRSPDIGAALCNYSQMRRAQTRFYGYASRMLTPFFQSDSRVAGWVRDLAFAPMAGIPHIRREMIRTLAGLKTGLLTSATPEQLFAD